VSKTVPVKLADVAVACGLSITTASHALSGNPRVPEATRQRVLDAARQLNYRPDPAARKLGRKDPGASKGVFQTAALLVSPREQKYWSSHEKPWKMMLKDRLRSYGYGIDVLPWTHSPKAWKQLVSVLSGRGINSAILAADGFDTTALPAQWEGIAWVCYSADPLRRHLHNVVIDHYSDSILSCEKAIALGYRRIALVLPDTKRKEAAHEPFVGGYLASAKQFGFEPVLEWIDHEWSASDVELLAQRIREKKVDCVLAENGFFLKKLSDWGVLPLGTGKAVLDQIDCAPGIAGIEQGRAARNRIVVDLLNSHALNHEFGVPEHPLLVSVPSRWLDGATLPPRSPNL
jgi:DNA-binding LacI/PurR family transcriptional regulator